MKKTTLSLLLLACFTTQQGFAQPAMQKANMAVNEASNAYGRSSAYTSTAANNYSRSDESISRSAYQQSNSIQNTSRPDNSKNEYEYQNRVNYSPYNDNSSNNNYRLTNNSNQNNSGSSGGSFARYTRIEDNDTLNTTAIMAEQARCARISQSDQFQHYWYTRFPRSGCNCARITNNNMTYNWYKCYENSSKTPAYDESAATWQSGSGSNAMYTALAGYIVYNNDTLGGSIVLTDDAILFSDETADRIIPYTDYALSAAAVAGNGPGNTLRLARIHPDDEILSRVLHKGKLLIYDHIYSFNKSYLDINQMSIVYSSNEREPLIMASRFTHMVKTVNKAYGLKLSPATCTLNQVMDQLNKLN